MSEIAQGALLLEHLLCALSGGANTMYFAALRPTQPGRRLAAQVLAVLSLGVSLQGLVIGWRTLVGHPRGVADDTLVLADLIVQGIVAAGSLAVSVLIVRRLLHEWRQD